MQWRRYICPWGLLRSWREWINPIPLAALALMALFGWYIIFGDQGLLTLRRLRGTKQSMLQTEQALTHRLEALHEETGRLQDPGYLEILLRKELGYVRPGETVYQFDAEPKEEHP
ncbi:MAG: septum formation initiator family protein [Deltaproteobacteria bacterium]|nr:septum formation initiator family protein [Deltaproteobacteria bacterium]